MEHESFEDEAIARVLNENFVCIKVDREERPDLDQIYMNAVMMLRQGQGGWPLSVFLTPDQEAFFGGTYWPPRSRMGMPGFDQVLHGVLDAYQSRRDAVIEQSKQITQWLNQPEATQQGGENEPSRQLLISAAQTLEKNFDSQYGGFGTAPKFPHTMDLALLVRLATCWPEHLAPGKQPMLEMVGLTLRKMAYGGIFDHLAGGFARYSVDQHWLVPHFEKMLYDNALLVNVYLDMFQVTKDSFYSMVVRKTLDYLLNYMTDGLGGFYSTEDADSEGVEGKFYVWSMDEIINVLGKETGDRFCKMYGVSQYGNFEGYNILNMSKSYQQFADLYGIDKEALRNEMREARRKLLEVRDRRVRPGKDDKILVSWNALAISAFARAAVILSEPRYGRAATGAANFIFEHMRRPDGRLLHTWRQGTAKLDAYLDDYSFLIVGLLDLYQVELDEAWIDRAIELSKVMLNHFGDSNGKAFFYTADDHEPLIARTKSFQDSSIPSGNAMAALALLRLGRLAGKPEWIDKAQTTIAEAMPLLTRSPLASGQMLIALDAMLSQSYELVLVGEDGNEIAVLLGQLRNLVPAPWELICRTGDSRYRSNVLDGLLAGKDCLGGHATLYVCSGFQCQPPVSGLEPILATVRQISADATRSMSAN